MAKRDRTRYGADALADGLAIVAAFHDPLRACASGDDADMMAPHYDDADPGPACIMADRCPIAREPQVAVRHSQLAAKPPPAPAGGTPADPGHPRDVTARYVVRTAPIAVVTASGRAPVVCGVMNGVVCALEMMSARLRGGLRERHCGSEQQEDSDEFLLHHHSTGYWVNETRARSGRGAERAYWEAQLGEKMSSAAERRVRKFFDQRAMTVAASAVSLTTSETGGAFAPPEFVTHGRTNGSLFGA
jgi:hypothetical protein